MTDSWIILKCAGRSTLRLAESLTEDGYETWIPIEVKTVRVPKLNAKRDLRLPMLAGFVFVSSAHILDMLDMANMPFKSRRGAKPAHADFSVFHYLDQIPLVADRALNPLRRIARRRTQAARATPLKKYQMVKATEGAGSFQGMSGRVEQSNERQTVVSFGGLFGRVEIATCLLKLDELGSNEPARKAA